MEGYDLALLSGFIGLLQWHRMNGTKPDGNTEREGVPWTIKELADECGKANENERRVAYFWFRKRNPKLPDETNFRLIERAFFGPPGASNTYNKWRTDFRTEYRKARDRSASLELGNADLGTLQSRRGAEDNIATDSNVTTDLTEPDAKPARHAPGALTEKSNADIPVPVHFMGRAESTSPESVRTTANECLGRDQELRALAEAILENAGHASILIQGGPGVGKTTITVEAACSADIVAHFGERRWFIPLETAADGRAFDVAVLRSFGFDPAIAKFDAVLEKLAEAPSLIILDNIETPWEADHQKVEERLSCLAQVRGIALLASCRGLDAICGPKWSLEIEITPIREASAETLFLSIANRISREDPHLDEMLSELGGLPLAIILVAQRARPFSSLSDVWREWKQTGVALARRTGVEPTRLTSLPVSIEFSLRSPRLTDAGHMLFRLLGSLPAGLGRVDREEILGKDSFQAAFELLATGLAFERANRLLMLPPIRDYAWRFRPLDDREASMCCRYYLQLMSNQGNRIWYSGGGAAIARLTPEWPNVESALGLASRTNSIGDALESLVGLTRFLATTGIGSPQAVEQLATHCEMLDDSQSAARCRWSLGDIALYRSDNEEARQQYERAMPLFERAGNAEGSLIGLARCLRGLGEISLRTTDLSEAAEKINQAMVRFRQVGDLFGEAYCLEGLGEIALRKDTIDTAETYFEKSKLMYQRGGVVLGEGNAVKGLADVAVKQHNYLEAEQLFEEAAQYYKQVDVRLGVANCMLRRADLTLERHDHGDNVSREALVLAQKTYQEMLSVYNSVADKLGKGNCYYGMGEVARRLGDAALARNQYTAALDMYEEIEESISVGWAYLRLAELADRVECHALLKKARTAWEMAGMVNLTGEIDRVALSK